MTNEEKVRQMSVEELAMIIMCPHEAEDKICFKTVPNCIKCCLDWLKEEADE